MIEQLIISKLNMHARQPAKESVKQNKKTKPVVKSNQTVQSTESAESAESAESTEYDKPTKQTTKESVKKTTKEPVKKITKEPVKQNKKTKSTVKFDQSVDIDITKLVNDSVTEQKSESDAEVELEQPIITSNQFEDIYNWICAGDVVVLYTQSKILIFHDCEKIYLQNKTRYITVDVDNHPSLLDETEWPEFLKLLDKHECVCPNMLDKINSLILIRKKNVFRYVIPKSKKK